MKLPSLVEMQYDPYTPRLSILINGKQPSDLSRLVQYADEEIWSWCKEIFETIYAEIRDDYVISFTGTKADAELVEFVSKSYKHCVGFRAKDFIVSESLQKRLGKLNQLIKKENITAYHKTIIDACFMVSPAMQAHLEDILGLDINNLFCSVRVSTLGSINHLESPDSFAFVVAENHLEAARLAKQLTTTTPSFAIYIGQNIGLTAINENTYFYETCEEKLFDTVFDCFLSAPLLRAFRNCLLSLSRSPQYREKLKKISMVEPLVNVDFDLPVETGKSNKLRITLEPSVGQLPKLEFKVTNSDIASCDGIAVFGHKAGSTKLEVYKAGEKVPFAEKDIKVIKRNRITKLLLSDDSVLLGEGDKKTIVCDYAPTNADNVREIAWKSTNDKVVSVDKTGKITALSVGECRIICTAENVSAQCICQVKPYLKQIILETPLEENILHLLPMQEEALSLKTVPNNSIDGKLTVETSDYNVVNVVGQKLIAKTRGEATITIRNSNKRLTTSFTVIVGKPPKRTIFQKLFGK